MFGHLRRLLGRKPKPARHRIHAALWREITRREWASHRYDKRQDSGQGHEQDWFEGMMDGFGAGTIDSMAAAVRHHRLLAWMVRERRRRP